MQLGDVGPDRLDGRSDRGGDGGGHETLLRMALSRRMTSLPPRPK